MKQAITPDILFTAWSPDEVAECLPGVSSGTYGALWALVRHYEDKPRSETPDDFEDRALSNWWDELTELQHYELNAAAEALRQADAYLDAAFQSDPTVLDEVLNYYLPGR
jgi:hypothetical protein